MKLMIPLLLVFESLLLGGCGVSEKEARRRIDRTFQSAEFSNIYSNNHFVVQEVIKIEGSEVGQVRLFRDDRQPFSALVIPYREIPPGTVVKMETLNYWTNPNIMTQIHVVR